MALQNNSIVDEISTLLSKKLNIFSNKQIAESLTEQIKFLATSVKNLDKNVDKLSSKNKPESRELKKAEPAAESSKTIKDSFLTFFKKFEPKVETNNTPQPEEVKEIGPISTKSDVAKINPISVKPELTKIESKSVSVTPKGEDKTSNLIASGFNLLTKSLQDIKKLRLDESLLKINFPVKQIKQDSLPSKPPQNNTFSVSPNVKQSSPSLEKPPKEVDTIQKIQPSVEPAQSLKETPKRADTIQKIQPFAEPVQIFKENNKKQTKEAVAAEKIEPFVQPAQTFKETTKKANAIEKIQPLVQPAQTFKETTKKANAIEKIQPLVEPTRQIKQTASVAKAQPTSPPLAEKTKEASIQKIQPFVQPTQNFQEKTKKVETIQKIEPFVQPAQAFKETVGMQMVQPVENSSKKDKKSVQEPVFEQKIQPLVQPTQTFKEGNKELASPQKKTQSIEYSNKGSATIQSESKIQPKTADLKPEFKSELKGEEKTQKVTVDSFSSNAIKALNIDKVLSVSEKQTKEIQFLNKNITENFKKVIEILDKKHGGGGGDASESEPSMLDDLKDKLMDKVQDKVLGKLFGKKGAKKGAIKAAQKGAVKAGEKGAIKAAQKGAVKAAEKGAAKAGEKGAVKAAEKGAVKAGEKGAVKAAEKGAAKAGEKVAESGMEKVLTTAAGKKGAAKAGEKGAVKAGEKGAVKAAEKGAAKAAEKGAVKAAEKGAVKAAEKGAVKAAQKGAVKATGKMLGKSIAKKIPILGALAGGYFALERALAGDFAGAAGELASGVAGALGPLGTGLSVAIDMGLAARDIKKSAEGEATEGKGTEEQKEQNIQTGLDAELEKKNEVAAAGAQEKLDTLLKKSQTEPLTEEEVADAKTLAVTTGMPSREVSKILSKNTEALKGYDKSANSTAVEPTQQESNPISVQDGAISPEGNIIRIGPKGTVYKIDKQDGVVIGPMTDSSSSPSFNNKSSTNDFSKMESYLASIATNSSVNNQNLSNLISGFNNLTKSLESVLGEKLNVPVVINNSTASPSPKTSSAQYANMGNSDISNFRSAVVEGARFQPA